MNDYLCTVDGTTWTMFNDEAKLWRWVRRAIAEDFEGDIMIITPDRLVEFDVKVESLVTVSRF